jgi:hypothetical protein
VIRPALLVAAAGIGALALTACGSSGSAYYVGSTGSAVARIEWSAPQSGRASGTITDDTLTGTAPRRSIDVQTVPVTVTFRGSTVMFAGAGLYALGDASLRGTLSGGNLRMQAPDASGYLESAVLRPGTAAGYDFDLATLKEHVRQADDVSGHRTARQHTTAQLATDQQDVSNDESTLASAVSQLSTDVAQIGTDLQQGGTDLQTLNADTASGCTNSSAVTQDDDTVNNDGSAVGIDATTITGDISSVQSAVSQLQTDDQAVQKDGGVPQGDPAGVISQAQSAITTAVSQANADIASMNGYMQQAYNTANSLATSSCPGDSTSG